MQLVHLTHEAALNSILRGGIKPSRVNWEHGTCVFATPVLPNYFVSHQWLRELKRNGYRTIVAVQFRIPDEEMVWSARYNDTPVFMTVAQAARLFMESAVASGLEIMIPRKIYPKEIMKTYVPPQVVGWRYHPNAKGTAPGYWASLPGQIRGKRILEAAKMKSRNEN
jgi:hypothetical protein